MGRCCLLVHGRRAVSYTHLDVYKRQIEFTPAMLTEMAGELREALEQVPEPSTKAVSYTHLWTQSDLHPKEGVSALLQRDIIPDSMPVFVDEGNSPIELIDTKDTENKTHTVLLEMCIRDSLYIAFLFFGKG